MLRARSQVRPEQAVSFAANPLRLYANPVKQAVLLAIFCSVGLFALDMWNEARFDREPWAYLLAVVYAVPCASLTLALGIRFLVHGVLRRPVLVIDAEGWHGRRGLLRRPFTVPWEGVQRVSMVYVRSMPRRSGQRGTLYLLVALGDRRTWESASLMKRIVCRFYPQLRMAAVCIVLNETHLFTTWNSVWSLLRNLRHRCNADIRLRDVRFDDETVYV